MSDTIPIQSSVADYLQYGQEYDASDIHLASGDMPKWRRHGTLQPIWPNSEVLTDEDVRRLAEPVMGEFEKERLETRGDADFAFQDHTGRYRASVVKQRKGLEMVFRVIDSKVRTMEELKLPESIKRLTEYSNGLILVTGSVGSGKSTTLAAMINEINETRADHIITVEDPVEFVHPSKKCLVNQREIPRHSKTFASALRAALREDPDIILVGEMRDLETISLAITASETGHLVLGTLHTGSAARTMDRVLDVFPTSQRSQIRIMVSESLRGVLSQQLLPTPDGEGRVLAMELMVNNPAIGNCVREGKTFMLPGIIQTGKNLGMITMDDHLQELYSAGKITAEVCYSGCVDKKVMNDFLVSHGEKLF